MCKNSDHLMKVRYGYCTNKSCNEDVLCPFRTKSLKCLASKSNLRYYEADIHNVEEQYRNNEPKCSYGCTAIVKELIENIIFEHGIIQPKKVCFEFKTYQFNKFKHLFI